MVSVAPWWRAICEAVLGQVDGHDPLGALQARAGHGAEPDQAAAEHRDGRAALDLRRVHRRAEPGREAAGEDAAQPSSGASGLTLASAISGITVYSAKVEVPMKWRIGSPPRREPRRAVGQVAATLLVADRDAAVRARAAGSGCTCRTPARTASRRGRPGAQRDAVADLLDDARALVAEHARRVAGRVGARGGVEVGVTDPAGDEPDEHLAGLRAPARSSCWTTRGWPNSSSTAARICISGSYGLHRF